MDQGPWRLAPPRGCTRDLHSARQALPHLVHRVDRRRPANYDSKRTSAIGGSSFPPAGEGGRCRLVLQVSFQGVIADPKRARRFAPPPTAACDHQPRIPRRPGPHRLVPFERRQHDVGEVSPERRGQILQFNHVGRRQCDRALDEPLQFANVAGPVVGDERVGGRGRQTQRPSCLVPFEEIPRELEDVVAPLTQGRHRDIHARQPIEQIGAELLALDQPAEPPIGCRNDPHVDAVSAMAADALDR